MFKRSYVDERGFVIVDLELGIVVMVVLLLRIAGVLVS